VVVDLFSHDTCKTANVNHRHVNNNKTANIKDKTSKFRATCMVDYTSITQLLLQKINKKGDITLHYTDIMAMCCRVIISPFYFFAVLVV